MLYQPSVSFIIDATAYQESVAHNALVGENTEKKTLSDLFVF
jgi:hypothetical protein